MILHKAMTKTEDGLFEIDMTIIRQMAQAFDEGLHNEECVIARFIVAAYDQGFQQGVHDSEERHQQTAILMMCTAGHA
jgi:hypothetical protein